MHVRIRQRYELIISGNFAIILIGSRHTRYQWTEFSCTLWMLCDMYGCINMINTRNSTNISLVLHLFKNKSYKSNNSIQRHIEINIMLQWKQPCSTEQKIYFHKITIKQYNVILKKSLIVIMTQKSVHSWSHKQDRSLIHLTIIAH